MRKKGTINGKFYRSIQDLAKINGINPATLYSRIWQGKTLEDAVGMGVTAYEVTVYGVRYQSMQEVSEEYGVDAPTLYYRVSAGNTLEEAIEMGKSVYGVEVYGVQHRSLAAVATYYGVDYVQLDRRRWDSGKTAEQVVTEMLATEPLTYEGKEYRSLVSLSTEYGADSATVSARLKRGWTMTAALLKPVAIRTQNTHTYRGVNYPTQREMVEAHGYTRGYVSNVRQRLGIDYIEALDLLVTFFENYQGDRPKQVTKVPAVIYNGEWVATIRDLCELTGVTRLEMKAYMNNNKLTSHFDALDGMAAAMKPRWYDLTTGEYTAQTKLVADYKTSIATLESKGMVRRDLVPRFPNCTYNPTGYCATPEKDFNAYIETTYQKV